MNITVAFHSTSISVATFEQTHGIQLPEDIVALLISEPESNDADLYNTRGVAYSESNQHDQAIKAFTKAIELKPDHAEVHYNRGIVYNIKGDYEHAIADYTKAIELKPDYADAYYRRSKMWLHLREKEKAKSDMKTASSIGINLSLIHISEPTRPY